MAVAGTALTGVHVAVAASGAAVLVGGRVAVGVTMLTGMINTSPTFMAFGSLMLFAAMMSSMVLSNRAAILAKESPACTTYSIFWPFGRLEGTVVAVGNFIPGLGIVIT